MTLERTRRAIAAGARIRCSHGIQISPTAGLCCLRTASWWCEWCQGARCGNHASPCPTCGQAAVTLPKGITP